MTDYQAIIRHESFRRFVTIVRVCTRPDWLQQHRDSRFWSHYRTFIDRNTAKLKGINGDLLTAFTGMMTEAVEADTNLHAIYTEDVPTWFVRLLDGDPKRRSMVLSLALAMASCEDKMLTPVEAAERTGKSESHWRNKTAAGNVPGAQKAGKQWLIPAQVVEFAHPDDYELMMQVSQYTDRNQSWSEDVRNAYGHTFVSVEEAVDYLRSQPLGGEIEVLPSSQADSNAYPVQNARVAEIIVMPMFSLLDEDGDFDPERWGDFDRDDYDSVEDFVAVLKSIALDNDWASQDQIDRWQKHLASDEISIVGSWLNQP